MAFKIDKTKCDNCGICASRCPLKAIEHNENDGYYIDTIGCIECGNCQVVCPNDAPTLVDMKKISLEKVIAQERYQVVYMPEPPENIFITNANTNRPGLMLSGYTNFFDPTRIQYIGLMERGYIDSLSSDKRIEAMERLMSAKPPAVILTRGQEDFPEMVDIAKKHAVPVLKTGDTTSLAMASASYYMSEQLAPTIQRHGVLVEVYGEGVLILGDSGVGKSETALELIKRGHRLIADDVVEIRRVNAKTISGMAPENIRYFMEVRGVGLIDARRMFGLGSIKWRQKIHMAVELEAWDESKVYNLMALDDETMDILGVKVPYTLIPIKPGRNVAMLIEVAAMNNRQKKMGYNAQKDLLERLEQEAQQSQED